MKFCTKTYGKWILTGEQSVIRGYPAIVFPLGNYALELEYIHFPKALEILAPAQEHATTQKLWLTAWSNTGAPDSIYATQGQLSIRSSIPVGQGLGASAALCLAITQCIYQAHPSPLSIWEFAKNLENLFHGQSSGLDILGAGSSQGMFFQKSSFHNLMLNWQPSWLLSHTREIGKTAEAIAKVKALIAKDIKKGLELDNNMAQSVYLAEKALASPQEIGLPMLSESMQQACNCFKEWGLITPKMQQQINALYQAGALAVKPTGSGGGGFLLSLWPSSEALEKLADDKHLKIILPTDSKTHLT